MDYSKLITVNYSAGTGGEFMSHLITCAIDGVKFENKPDDNNKFTFIRKFKKIGENELPVNPQLMFYIHKNKTLQESMRRHTLEIDTLKSLTLHFVRQVNFYDFVAADTDQQVISNIIETMRQMVDPPTSYLVLNFHNVKFNVRELGLQNIFPGSFNLTLASTDIKNHFIFWFLGWYKNRVFRSGLIDSEKIIIQDKQQNSDPYFHNETVFYMDELIFGKNYVFYEDQLDKLLSDRVGREVKVDRAALAEYRLSNQKIIRDFFNIPENRLLIDTDIIEQITNYMVSLND